MTSEHFRRVLVVDDDIEIRRILVTALRQRGLAIDEAVDGQQAVDLLRENTYSVIVLDLLMPGIDGFGVLDAVGERDGQSPVVLVVTGADRPLLDRIDSQKIHGIVRKPFDPQEVAAVVAACAEIRGRSVFETMALATMITGAPLIALLRL
jgi:DNA-binding response OmpR family regulator